MATKKASKKSSKKINSATANAMATQPDPVREVIFACIQGAFAAQGLNPITSALNQIVWSSIPKSVITKIGSAVRACVKSKLATDPGELAAVLLVLSSHEPVMSVATLIDDLIPLLS